MCYKQSIRTRIDSIRENRPGFTLSGLANKIEIEPSYLSRFFTTKTIHFSDDLLYRMLKELNLSEPEIDFLLLLKDLDRAQHPDRKRFLQIKLRAHRLCIWRTRLNDLKKQLSEMNVLVEQLVK